MGSPDTTLQAIEEALEHAGAGHRDQARKLLRSLWVQVTPDGNPLHRVAVAHTMADLCDDDTERLRWDQRALDAADEVTDVLVADAGMPGTAAALRPSLHLNVADAHLRIGDPRQARIQALLGRATLAFLPEEGYRSMIQDGLQRIIDATA